MQAYIDILSHGRRLETLVAEIRTDKKQTPIIQIDLSALIHSRDPHLPVSPFARYNPTKATQRAPNHHPTKEKTMSRRSERRKARMEAGGGIIQRFLDPENDHPILKQLWKQFQPMIQQLLTQAISGLLLAMDDLDDDEDESPAQLLG